MIEYRRWDIDDGGNIRSLESWRNDFWSVLFAGRSLLELQLPQTYENFELVEAAFSGLIIRYMRPFSSGVRKRLDLSSNPNLSESDIESHKYFSLLRNRHIAHPVCKRETSSVFVGIKIGTSTHQVTSVSSGSSSIGVYSKEDIQRLISLCKTWLDWINAEHKKACQELESRARSMTSEELVDLQLGPREPTEDPTVKLEDLDTGKTHRYL